LEIKNLIYFRSKGEPLETKGLSCLIIKIVYFLEYESGYYFFFGKSCNSLDKHLKQFLGSLLLLR
jgi:hypothetical protein